MCVLLSKADIAEVDGQSALCQKRQQQCGYSVASSAPSSIRRILRSNVSAAFNPGSAPLVAAVFCSEHSQPGLTW
jgi:hypothetical protein